MAEKGKYLKEVSQSERQMYILDLLSVNPQGFRIQDIVDKFDGWGIAVKPRTIQRDIDALSVNFFIVEEERGRDIYYRADKYSLENIDITMADLMSIAFIQELLGQYRGLDVANHGVAFLERITKKLGIPKKMQFMDFQNMIKDLDVHRSKNLDVKPEIEHAVRNAIDQHKKLKIEYYSWNSDQDSTRVIHPYRFVMIDGYMNVEAFCEMRSGIRNFRLSRIQKLELLEDTFVVQQELLSGQLPFIHLQGGEPEQLVLQFDAVKGRYVEEYDYDRADRLVRQEDGSILFYKKTAITDEVRQYVLGFGSHVKVIEPAHLAAAIQEEIDRIRMLYQTKK